MLIFKGKYTFINLPVKRDFANKPLSHFPRTHCSIIPLFQHSNCERSELTCNLQDFDAMGERCGSIACSVKQHSTGPVMSNRDDI